MRILRWKITHRALILGFSLGLSTLASAVDFATIGTLAEQRDMSAQETDKLFEWYKKAAEQGDASAQYNLGEMYAGGDSVPQSYEKTFEWIQKAANQEIVAVQRRLGWLYDTGSGVQQDDTNAVKWYRKAADKGDAES